MDRRHFLGTLLAAAGAHAAGCAGTPPPRAARIMTVTGAVPAERLGLTLPHEHVLVDFVGADAVSPARYDRGAVYEVVRPYLDRLYRLGGRALFEATPAYLGRDPLLLRRLAEDTGLHLVTNTGYYGARDDRHLPPHAFTDDADALATRWVREWTDGLDGTGVRPGFIKIGVDAAPLSDVDRKLVRAAARAHRQTGLTVAVHTGPAAAALEELAVFEEEGVDPSAWVWVHAQAEDDVAQHARVAARGGWVSFDGLGPQSLARHVSLVTAMKARGHLDRVLVSHDAGWYHVGEPGGGAFRAYDTLFDDFLPALHRAGFTDDDVRRLTVENPAAAFAVRIRT